jgi:hypothetical protein|tara:strand:+ start:1062 stop:1166 length:105 start_codon:yes stop_codon:yes gene_type:complete
MNNETDEKVKQEQEAELKRQQAEIEKASQNEAKK